jgi:tetratricopeptide (TPR) repeat protein
MADKAEKLKEQGNAAFTAKNYKEAIRLYSEAIAAVTDPAAPALAVYYSNRAAAYQNQNDHKKAVQDAEASLKVGDPSLVVAVTSAMVQSMCTPARLSPCCFRGLFLRGAAPSDQPQLRQVVRSSGRLARCSGSNRDGAPGFYQGAGA